MALPARSSAIDPRGLAPSDRSGLVRVAVTIAEMLGMAKIRVLEVATFYTMFLLQPVGRKAHVQVCGTTPCVLRGADDVKDVCVPALRHRMIRRPEAEIQGVSEVAAVQRAVGRVPVPR